jgi:hypothetical protein
MTRILELTPELEERLTSKAKLAGKEPDAFLLLLIENALNGKALLAFGSLPELPDSEMFAREKREEVLREEARLWTQS